MTGLDQRPPPPWLALWLLARVLPPADAEFALGDLVEDYARVSDSIGRGAARRWFWRQTLRVLLGRARPPARDDAPGQPSSPRRARLGDHVARSTHDVRAALRQLRSRPWQSAAVVVTLALGIGANVAVFSVAWPVLIEPLPVPDENRLAVVTLWVERTDSPGPNPISPGDYVDIRRARSFESIAGFHRALGEGTLTGHGDPQALAVGYVTEDFFDVLGVMPLAGRRLDARDAVPGANAILLRERAWRRHLNADPGVVGQAVRIDGQAWSVAGVMPDAAAIGTLDADVWIVDPVDEATARQQRSYHLLMLGRLRSDVTLEAANAELSALMRNVAERHPITNNGLSARAESFRERLTGPVRPVFLLLIGGAILVLVVAGINLAGLQAARHLERADEIAVRGALGAARSRIVRQLTTESLVVAAIGGAAGLGAASITLRGLAIVAPAVGWYEISPAMTLPIAVYTVTLALATGALVGIGPALVSAARAAVAPTAVRGAIGAPGVARSQAVILAAQIAMTVVLLIAASLIGASLVRVLRVDTGFELDRGLIADVRATGPTSAIIGFFHDLVDRVEALPGVERACAISEMPLDTSGGWMTYVAEHATDADRVQALPLGATEHCFDALRVPIVAGRSFVRTETESVAIVSESMAAALWPASTDVVGRRLHIGLVSGPLFTVVGVARDIRAGSLETPGFGQVWTSAARGWPSPQRLIVRTRVPPEAVATQVRSTLAAIDPDLALAKVRTLGDVVATITAPRRFVLVLSGGFAGIALLLSAVGIYGSLSHQIGRRTREIGIRLALGARAANIRRAVARQAFTGVAAGVAAGAVAAWALSSALAAQLFEMSATDLRVYSAVVLFVMVVAAVAGACPLRRAVRIDPLDALRD